MSTYEPPGMRRCARCNRLAADCDCKPRVLATGELERLEEARDSYTLCLLALPRDVAISNLRGLLEDLAEATTEALADILLALATEPA